MIKIIRANRVIEIEDSQLAEYEADGYKIYDLDKPKNKEVKETSKEKTKE